MFSNLLKTRRHKASLIGGIGVLIVTLAMFASIQPGHSAAGQDGQFLTGAWMFTVPLPNGSTNEAPCTFTADLVSSGIGGHVSCIGLQSPLGDTGATLRSTAQGNWTVAEDGSFRAVLSRTAQTPEGAFVAELKSEFTGISYVDDGNQKISGEASQALFGPDGNQMGSTLGPIPFEASRISTDPIEFE